VKIQAGNREAPPWRATKPCSRRKDAAALFVCDPWAEPRIDRDMNQKPGSGRAQITSFNFPNNPIASDSSRATIKSTLTPFSHQSRSGTAPLRKRSPVKCPINLVPRIVDDDPRAIGIEGEASTAAAGP
jgi:hypothetical protein